MIAADFKGNSLTGNPAYVPAGGGKGSSLTGNPAYVPAVGDAPLHPRARADHSSGPPTTASVARPLEEPLQARPKGARHPRPAQPAIEVTRQLHNRVRETVLEEAKLKTAQQTVSRPTPPASTMPVEVNAFSVVATTQLETTVLHIEGTPADVEEAFRNGDMRATSVTKIPQNTRMVLFYPQLQLKNDRYAVYMRTHLVDSDTGAIRVGYCRCFDAEADTGIPLRYMGGFTAI
jgi:hypothetical protein